MPTWLKPALDYLPQWLEMQVAETQLPGCAFAVTHRGKLVLERAFGVADLETHAALTPKHRFRVASHSKSFTATGIMRLVESRKLRLDAPGRQIRVRTARAHRLHDAAAVAVARRRRASRRSRQRAMGFAAAVPRRRGPARRSEDGAHARARCAFQIFQSRIRSARARHRIGDGYAVLEVDTPRGDRTGRTHAYAAGRTRWRAHADEQRLHRAHAVRPAAGRSRSADPCARLGHRLRQHRRRPRALLQPARSEIRFEIAERREPPRNDPRAPGHSGITARDANTDLESPAGRSAPRRGSATQAASPDF